MAPRLLAYVSCLLDERDCLLVVVPGGMAAETSAADRIGSCDAGEHCVADRRRPCRSVVGFGIQIGKLGEGYGLVVPLVCVLRPAGPSS
jgi:hypothetical protein